MTRHPEPPWKDAEPDEASFAARALEEGAWAVGAPQRCPPPEMLRAAMEAVLPDDAQALVSAHVQQCRVCQGLAEALDDPALAGITCEEQARVTRSVRAKTVRAGLRWPLTGWLWRWAPIPVALAALLVMLAIGWLVVRAPTPPPSSAGVVEPAGRGREATPSAFTLEKAAVRLPAASVILWRSEKAAVPEGSVRDLAAALEPYGRGDFADAAQRLTGVARTHPANAAAHFYLGVSDLFLQRDAEAVTALETAKRLAGRDQVLADDVAWYLAVALQRIGQRDNAVRELRPLCAGQGPRTAQACAGLKELAPAVPEPR